MRMFKDVHLVLRKDTNPQNEHLGVRDLCTQMCGTVEVRIARGLQTVFHILPGDVKKNHLQEGQKNARFLAFQRTKRWKTGMIMVSPNLEILLIRKHRKRSELDQSAQSDTRLHFTLQSIREKYLVIIGQCSIWSSSFYIVKRMVSIFLIKYFEIKQFFHRDSILNLRLLKLDDWSWRKHHYKQYCLRRNFPRQNTRSFFGNIRLRISDCFFVLTFFIWLTIFACFWKLLLSKCCDKSTVCSGFCVVDVDQNTIYPHQDHEQNNF